MSITPKSNDRVPVGDLNFRRQWKADYFLGKILKRAGIRRACSSVACEVREVRERRDRYEVTLNLRGVVQGTLRIEALGKKLLVSGHWTHETTGQFPFNRAVLLPSSLVSFQDAHGFYGEGVLKIRLPKLSSGKILSQCR